METPLISVILPLYNESEPMAKQSIDSILKQTYSHIEIILLLDNPENEILKGLIRYYKKQDYRVIVHINEHNLGLPDTLNRGIELASGEYIARMDGDDISVSTRLSKQIDFLLKNSHIDLVGSDAYAINEEGEFIGEYHKLRTDYSQKMMLRCVAINLIHPTWLGKIKLFQECQYRNFTHCEDYDLMMRACALGYNFHNIQEKLLLYRIQQTNLQSVSRKYAYEQYINTLRVREQYKQLKKERLKSYPPLPQLTYNQKDKERYQSTISQLNQLREAFFKKRVIDFVILFTKVAVKDFRPLSFRLKVLVLSKSLQILEKVYLHA